MAETRSLASRLVWFVVLWAASVGAVGLLAVVIRFALAH